MSLYPGTDLERTRALAVGITLLPELMEGLLLAASVCCFQTLGGSAQRLLSCPLVDHTISWFRHCEERLQSAILPFLGAS